MQAEVDQSGRIDQTNRPTVLAISDGISLSILISARDKQAVLVALRRIKPKWSTAAIHIHVFSALLHLLLCDVLSRMDLVIIDPEFPGHEALIKDRLLTLCRGKGVTVHNDQITFHRIGRKSPAHSLAWQVYTGLSDPDRVISLQDVMAEFGNRR